MANTKQGIYYQDNYSSVADVPSDMKKMAESVDTELEKDRGRLSTNENNISELQSDNETNKENISNLQSDNTANKENIKSLQTDNTTNKKDISDIKQEQVTQNENIEQNTLNIANINEEIANINEKDTAQDTNIETLTQRLNEKDNQIAELEDKVSDLNNNQIHGQASGEYVHLSDSAKMECKIGILGNSKQETRQGYNLFNTDKITENKYIDISKGILFDSSVTNTSDYIEVKANETYIFVYKYSTLLNENIRSYCMFDTDKNYLSGDIYAVKEKKIIFNPTQDGYIRISFDKNCTDIMFYKGTDNKEYEQYGAMPSIEFESEIEAVGDNKNLFDKDTVTKNKIVSSETGEIETSTVSNRDTSDFIKVKPNENYVCNSEMKRIAYYTAEKTFIKAESLKYAITTPANCEYVRFTYDNSLEKIKFEKGTIATTYSPYNQGSANVKVYNENLADIENGENKFIDGVGRERTSKVDWGCKDYIKFESNRNCIISLKEICNYLRLSEFDENRNFIKNTEVTKANVLTITTHKNTKLLKWSFNYNSSAIDVNIAKTLCLQLKEGTETDYIPHEEQNYPVDMQEPFRAINDIRDCFVLKEDGKWYERHKVGEYIFKGTEEINYNSSNVIAIRCLKNMKKESYTSGYSNIAVIRKSWNELLYNYNSFALTDLQNDGVYDTFWYNNSSISSKTNEEILKMLKGNYVIFPLETPTDVECTEQQTQQLKALLKAKTYKNITNITTDTIAVLDVDYKRDLETYQKQQDDRITAIEQLLSTTATSAMLLDNVQSDLESEVK